jgi:hypothetical protein
MRAHIGSRREWAWRHQVFSRGLDHWNMDAFISTLPLLLHAALFAFLVGLVVFLWDVDRAIAITLLTFTSLVATFYIGSTIAPLWFGSCPTATPILRQARAAAEKLSISLRLLCDSLWRYCVRAIIGREVDIGDADTTPAAGRRLAWKAPAYDTQRLFYTSPAHRDSNVLSWMVASLPASEDVAVALDAIGGLDPYEHRELYVHPATTFAYGLLHDICVGEVLVGGNRSFGMLHSSQRARKLPYDNAGAWYNVSDRPCS